MFHKRACWSVGFLSGIHYSKSRKSLASQKHDLNDDGYLFFLLDHDTNCIAFLCLAKFILVLTSDESSMQILYSSKSTNIALLKSTYCIQKST